MESFEQIAVWVLILAAGLCYLKIRIHYARKEARKLQLKSRAVLARVKKQENGLWRCKFFWYGNRWGYIRTEPSSDRVDAFIVGYDEDKEMFELEEFKQEED